MENFVGQITLMPAGSTLRSWVPCDGRKLPINQNQTLFTLLGTRFGGDGRTNFAVPDLQSKSPLQGLAFFIATSGVFPPRGA